MSISDFLYIFRCFFTYVDLLENLSALTAGLRRSFRLSRKDHQGSTKESRPAESEENEFIIYEEVTLYQMRPQDKPRLVVLIGKIQGTSGHSKRPSESHFLFFLQDLLVLGSMS